MICSDHDHAIRAGAGSLVDRGGVYGGAPICQVLAIRLKIF